MRESLARLGFLDRIILHLGGILAAGLTFALGGLGFHLLAAWPAGEVAAPDKTPQIQALREQRLATLRRRVELVDQRCRSGSGSRAEVVAAKRDVAEAELADCANQEQRVRLLERMIDDATTLETQAVELARKNVASEEAALVIRADLLQLKIRLMEAQPGLLRDHHGCEDKPLLSVERR